MESVLECFEKLPPGIQAKLHSLKLGPARVHTWALLSTTRVGLVPMAFELDEFGETNELHELVNLLWGVVEAAAGPAAAQREGRLAVDATIRSGSCSVKLSTMEAVSL